MFLKNVKKVKIATKIKRRLQMLHRQNVKQITLKLTTVIPSMSNKTTRNVKWNFAVIIHGFYDD